MPLASSIRWTPTGEAARGDPPFSIFITQRALVAVHDHLVAGPTRCGFLTGGLLHCPETEQPYVLIDSTIWLPGLNVGHDAKRLIAQGWSLADEELRATRRHLVGWYNGHPAAGTTLSRSDADAHLTFFDRPWHVVLVVASGDDPTGGFFCRTTSQEWASEHLPFYEVLDGEAPPPDTPKTTVVSWRNYRTEEEVIAASDVALVAGQGTQTRVLFPDEFDEEPVPTSPQQLHRFRRVARYGLYGLAGLVPALGLFGLYLARGAESSHGRSPTAEPAAQPAAQLGASDRLDPLADTVALATAAFDLRARLFQSRRMACSDLARGLTDVEQRWMAYNMVHRGAPVSRDSARGARDQSLYADVDAVERKFERSTCPRP